MKPMTKERLEALREKCTSDYLTFLEGNEIMDEIQRLRGALEKIAYIHNARKVGESYVCDGMPFYGSSAKIIVEALSPSDETEVTK